MHCRNDGGASDAFEARVARMLVSAVLGLAVALALAPLAGAHGRVSFERMKGYDAAGDPRQVRQGRRDQVRLAQCAQRARPQPRHLGQRRVLRAAGQGRRQRGRGAGRSGRSSAGRTCSRTTRTSTRPSPARPRRQQVFDYYLGWLTDPTITNHFQLIPDSEVGFGREWGMRVEIEDLHRVVTAAKRARRQGRARRALARRLDHDRVRDLGLPRQARRATICAAWCSSTAAAARRRDAPSRRTQRSTPGRLAAVADLRRDPRAVRRALQHQRLARRRSWRPTSPSLGWAWPAAAREPEAAGAASPTSPSTATRSTPRRRRRRSQRRRPTWAASPPAATRAAGSGPARSPRSGATPRCSPAGG